VRKTLVVTFVEAVVDAFFDDRVGVGLGTSGHHTLLAVGGAQRAATGTDDIPVCQPARDGT
jgi:hypothetical protein